jgi:hypothetical protein
MELKFIIIINNLDEDEKVAHLNALSFKKYNNNKYQEQLSSTEKAKKDLTNESISINSDLYKINKINQSRPENENNNDIDLSYNIKNNHDEIKKNAINNENIKSKNKNGLDIIQKRGISTKMEQKNKVDIINDENEQKRIKVTLNQMKKSINNNKDETIELRKNENGVRYILFTFKTDFKKYKKEKWILTPTKEIVIFLKSVITQKKNKQINKVIFNNRNNKDKNYNNSNSKNKTTIQKIYKAKRNYENLYLNKTIKESNKSQNDYEYENNEKSDNANRNSITIKTINQKIVKKGNDHNDNSSKKLFYDYSFAKGVNKNNKRNNNDINIEDNYTTKNAKSTLNFKIVEDNFYNYYKNNQKTLNINDRHFSPSQFNNESNDFRNKENLYFIIDKKNFISRRNKPNYTVTERRPKNIHKIKYKKAKIKKFVPNKNIYEPESPERRGNLYDYYKNSNSTGNISCVIRKDNNKKKKKKKTKKENHFIYNNNAESSDSEDNERNIIKNKIFSSDKKMKANRNRNNINMQTNPINSCSVTNINGTRSNIIHKTHKKINSLESNNSKLLKTASLGGTYKNKNSLHKAKPKIIHNNNSMPNINENNLKIELKTRNEMSGIDAIKSRFKQRLIEINDNLLDAIHYYNGPIDISCISCKNYVETVEDLKIKFAKKGYKSLKSENNYLKFTNGTNIYLIEIVIIRNNMLYYLVHKN